MRYRLVLAAVVLWASNRANAADASVFKVDGKKSEVVAHLQRGGVAARLAHDHLVRAVDIEGTLTIGHSQAQSAVSLRIDAQTLSVDDEALRKRYGMKAIKPADRKKIALNMHGKEQLATAQYPKILFSCCRAAEGTPTTRSSFVGELTLRGKKRQVELRGQLSVKGNVATVDGKMTIRQSEFGYEPYSALGGLIRVKDDVTLNVHLVARK